MSVCWFLCFLEVTSLGIFDLEHLSSGFNVVSYGMISVTMALLINMTLQSYISLGQIYNNVSVSVCASTLPMYSSGSYLMFVSSVSYVFVLLVYYFTYFMTPWFSYSIVFVCLSALLAI